MIFGVSFSVLWHLLLCHSLVLHHIAERKQKVQVCDATGDAKENKSWAQKIHRCSRCTAGHLGLKIKTPLYYLRRTCFIPALKAGPKLRTCTLPL